MCPLASRVWSQPGELIRRPHLTRNSHYCPTRVFVASEPGEYTSPWRRAKLLGPRFLPRQSIYSRLAGYEEVNDAERLLQAPTFRWIGSAKILGRGAALPWRLHWFETEVLSQACSIRRGTNQLSASKLSTFRACGDSSLSPDGETLS